MHVVLTIALVLTCMWSPVAAQLASCVASTPCSAISNDSSLFLDSLPFSNASRTFLQCSLPDSDLLRPVFTEYCTVRARSAPAVVSSNNCGFGALSLVPVRHRGASGLMIGLFTPVSCVHRAIPWSTFPASWNPTGTGLIFSHLPLTILLELATTCFRRRSWCSQSLTTRLHFILH